MTQLLSKGRTSKHDHTEVKISTYELWRDANIQSIAEMNSVPRHWSPQDFLLSSVMFLPLSAGLGFLFFLWFLGLYDKSSTKK